MHIKSYILLILFFIAAAKTYSQSTYRFGSIPSINLNKDLKRGWNLNYKSEFRYMFEEGIKNISPSIQQKYIHTDFSLLASKNIGLGNKFAFGFLARVTNKRIIQRYIQQFIILRNYDGFRMSYRFSADQTFGESNVFRFRYRTSSEIPLEGLKVDKSEFYLKLNQEILNNFQSNNYDMELRFVPNLGYKFKDNNKVEIGVDYRINNFLKTLPRHTVFVALNWYVKI